MSCEEAKVATKVSSCKTIAHLSKIQYHDSRILSAKQNNLTLSLRLESMDYNDNTEHLFKFHQVDIHPLIDYSSFENFQIIVEEVCVKTTGVYEYNLIVTKTSDTGREYDEFSICFDSVELKYVPKQ